MAEKAAKHLSKAKPMTLRFAFSSPAHVLASFFGSGVITPAPGTWGTLAGWLVYVALHPWCGSVALGALTALALFAGAWACQKTADDIGVHDHGSIVIDEVFAIWLVLLTLPPSLPWQIAAFCAFRFFDIVKIWPSKYFDSHPRWHNGWGVMLDDAAAAVQSIIVLHAARLALV